MSASTPPANQATVNPYDEVPYHSRCFIQTHPQRLAFIGRLFGMDPAKASNCRVLELGSASGGNLIPLALRYPQSQFLGLDYAEVQVIEGKKQVEALGLKNLEIRQADLGEYDVTKDGKFDYIICHGVYSWVPPHVLFTQAYINDANLGVAGPFVRPTVPGTAIVVGGGFLWTVNDLVAIFASGGAGVSSSAPESVAQGGIAFAF